MKETEHVLTSDGNFCTIGTDTELYHYGVKGMKWGVRRYQNYDGSYTKKGLERFRKAEAEYDSAKVNKDKLKEAYKSGNATKQEYGASKIALRSAKREMKESYNKLKSDYMADQGKKLYAQGKTIGGNRTVSIASHIGIAGGRIIANKILDSTLGDTKIGKISTTAVNLGSIAANVAIGAKTSSENRKLRAYYGH